jgi:hypothetical protein
MTSPTPGPSTPAAPTDVTPAAPTPAPSTVTTTSTTTPTPAPATSVGPGVSGAALTTAVLSGAVVAAVVSGWVNAALARRSTRLEERARVRSTLAEAFQAYADYKEFPYAIRRRRADQPAEERIRLSEEVRRVQSRLSYYEAWTLAESPETGAAYNELTRQLRRVAGGSMREAWQGPALDDDQGMNIGADRVDLSGLKDAEQTFLGAAEAHVAALTTPRWWRAVSRLTGGIKPRRRSDEPVVPPTRPGSPEPDAGPREDAPDR